MKQITFSAAVMALGLTACDTMNRPIDTGNFDPLRPPGSGNLRLATGPGFSAGQFVSSIMDNTAFFSKRPKGDADADKLLPRGTSMRVISSDESYVRVELDSGEVGWVPTVMVEDPNTAAATGGEFDALNPNEIQIYPPLNGMGGTLPPSTPSDPPPEGAIPTVIDPENLEPATPTTPAPLPEVPGSTPLPDIGTATDPSEDEVEE